MLQQTITYVPTTILIAVLACSIAFMLIIHLVTQRNAIANAWHDNKVPEMLLMIVMCVVMAVLWIPIAILNYVIDSIIAGDSTHRVVPIEQLAGRTAPAEFVARHEASLQAKSDQQTALARKREEAGDRSSIGATAG